MKLSLFIFCLLLLSILLSIPAGSVAQMFSVDEPEQQIRPASSALSFGVDLIDMNFRGDEEKASAFYNISDPVYRIRLELPGIEGYAGFGSSIGDSGADADTLSYLNLGANISGFARLAGDRRLGILLPLWLSTDYTRVRSTSVEQPEAEQFRQSSASIGIGAAAFLNMRGAIRIFVEMVPQIGFTVSSLGADSGQLTSLNGRARIQRDQIMGRYGVMAGYSYTWRRYSGTGEMYKHNISMNNFSLGITF